MQLKSGCFGKVIRAKLSVLSFVLLNRYKSTRKTATAVAAAAAATVDLVFVILYETRTKT